MSAQCCHGSRTVDPEQLSRWGFGADLAMQTIIAQDQESMGFLEEELGQQTKELQRQILQKATQAKAERCPPNCPRCGRALTRVREDQERGIETRFGPIRIKRLHGYCKACQEWFYPADWRLGVNKNAGASPSVQETAALMVSKMPPAEAEKVIQRVAGIKISRSTLDREARRQGKRAQDKRDQMDNQLGNLEGYREACEQAQAQLTERPFTMVIEIDAWNIRERDQWGQTEELRRQGEDPSRWHWVYTGTCFGLDQRAQTQSGRSMILSRGYVATREGIDSLSRQIRSEAVRRGLSQAQKVLVVADGAIWIWNMIQDRFAGATQRLDYYHASEHLWEVARELHGRGTPEASKWIKPLLKQLKNGQGLKVIQSLKELENVVEGKIKEKVESEREYFQNNKSRLDYDEGKKLGEPIGSGAIEATCRQYQCRFKRAGQFWSRAGDEALLTLETFWRNERWHILFPHSHRPNPAKN